jgi:ABC-2 type transport system permease protein
MRKTWLVTVREMKASLQRWSYVLFAFGLPLGMGLVSLVILLLNRDVAAPSAPSVPQPERHGIVRPAGTLPDFSSPLFETLPTLYPDETAAAAALAAGEIDGYYLVAADYIESGEVVYITEHYNPLADATGGGPLRLLLLADLLEDPGLAALVAQPLLVHENPLEAIDTPEGESWIVDLLPLLMVVILYMAIVMTAGNLVNAITDEKKNRVLEVLLLSASPRQLIAGKMLAMGLLGLLQLGVWLGVLWCVIRFGGQPLQIPEGFALPAGLVGWMIVYSLLGYAIYGALMAGLGALAPDLKDARSLSFLLQLPLIFAYLAAFFIFEGPGGPLPLVASLFPLTAPVAMMARLVAGEVPLWQPLLAAGLQVITAVLIIYLVARMFRAQVLLSGEAVSAGRYFRTLLSSGSTGRRIG